MKVFLLIFLLTPGLAFAKGFVPASFSANFEESLVSVTGKVRKTFGKVDYKFPGHFRLELTSPPPSLTVVNPKKMWIFQPAAVKGEKDQVTIHKSGNQFLIKFFDSIHNGVENSKLFTTKYGKTDLTLVFVKTIQKEMGFEEVILHANKDPKKIKELKGFEKITVNFSKNKKTSIRLIDLQENVSFPSGHFEFRPSKNTKVIEN